MQKVLDKGTWFAEWHKDFNNYLALTVSTPSDEKKHGEKLTLQSFLLGVSPKAPVRHLNGNTLDNRKSNLEIFNQNTKNDYRTVDENTMAVILRDKYGKEIATTLIDKEDLNKVTNSANGWVRYVSNQEPYAISNTESGRVYLDRLIMDTDDNMVVHHINLNTLDNRKSNLENKKIDTSCPEEV